ncbi:MAG: folate family ECF transporter S component [Lachnospira sp.]
MSKSKKENIFLKSAKEFNSVKSLATAALLVALHTVLACFVSIQVTNSLRISISFLTNVITGYLFGPVMGLVCAGIGDVIGYFVKPVGPFFYGWTVSASLAGFIYGTFFYGKAPKKLPVGLFSKKNKDSKEQVSEEKTNGRFGVYEIIAVLTTVANVAVWFVCPFVSEIKENGRVYTAFGTAKEAFASGSFSNVSIVAIIMLVGMIVALVSAFVGWAGLASFVNIITSFVSWLAVYTDKKTIKGEYGFYLIVALSVMYVVILAVKLMKRHAIDISFLIRCVLVMTFDTLLVNVLLGTFWVTQMYGKGFSFYFTSRLIKNLIQLPVNIILVYYILGFISRIRKKLLG